MANENKADLKNGGMPIILFLTRFITIGYSYLKTAILIIWFCVWQVSKELDHNYHLYQRGETP